MLVAVRSDDPGAVERSMKVWTGGGKQWRRAVAQRAVFRCRERGTRWKGMNGPEIGELDVFCTRKKEKLKQGDMSSRFTCASMT